MSLLHLPALQPGDTVGLVAPAGPVVLDQVQSGLDTLERQGLRYLFGKFAFINSGLTAGSRDERLTDIYRFLEDPQIRALWSLRGGYGSIQLLKHFDFELFRSHPKLLIGFSDLTALQWALSARAAICSFSGLTLTTQFRLDNPYLPLAMEVLHGKRMAFEAGILKKMNARVAAEGKADGLLMGGTLSMICCLIGTPYWPQHRDVLLFLEDVNEPLYRIDRMLQQLDLVNFWDSVRGIILGKFLFDGKELNILPLLRPLISRGIPIIENFPYGHMDSCCPLPLRVPARLQTSPMQLEWQQFLF